jgi:hypothetical protein
VSFDDTACLHPLLEEKRMAIEQFELRPREPCEPFARKPVSRS